MGTEDTDRDQLYSWLQQWPSILQQMEMFELKLQRRHIRGSHTISKLTLEILRNTIGTCRWSTAQQLIERLWLIGRVLVAAQPLEPAIGNIVRRVLFLIREEFMTQNKESRGPQMLAKDSSDVASQTVAGSGSQVSLQTILGPKETTDYSAPIKDLRQGVIEGVGELVDEMDSVLQSIADQALEHIHAREVILTIGKSETVELFLKTAAKKRQFSLIVAESSPSFEGQETARSLALAGIDTVLINDGAVFALMSRVNKVIIGTHAVMANGGLITNAGAHAVALAAKEHSVPVVCVTGLFKLSPLFPHDCDIVEELACPAPILHAHAADRALHEADIVNPEFDYIPPELISLFVTNVGGHQPSYVYRLLAELYAPEDVSFGQSDGQDSEDDD